MVNLYPLVTAVSLCVLTLELKCCVENFSRRRVRNSQRPAALSGAIGLELLKPCQLCPLPVAPQQRSREGCCEDTCLSGAALRLGNVLRHQKTVSQRFSWTDREIEA